MAKNKGGRPPKFNETVIKKLEEAFSIDATVLEACFYADISSETFYTWIKKEKKLSDRFTALRERPVLLARQSVVKGLKDDPDLALKYLKNKRRDEFSERQEQTGKDGGPIEVQNVPLTTNQKRIIAMGVLDKLNSMDDSDQENLAIEQV